MKNGRWANDVLCTGAEDLSQYLVRLAHMDGITTIRVDECYKNGDLIQ
jgi:hypothetical protein